MNDDRKFLRVILFILIMMGIAFMSYAVPQAMPPEARPGIATIFFFLSFVLFWFSVTGFLKWEGKNESIEDLGLHWTANSTRHLTIGAIAGILASSMVVALAWIFGGDLRPAADITSDLIASEIIITAPVAFFEELAYRGYLMTRIEELVGRNIAILTSSMIFSLMHFSWWTRVYDSYLILFFFFNIFLGGVVLGYGYYASGRKLWVPISFHFAWNVIAYILFPQFPLEPVTNPGLFQIEWGLTTILGFLFGLSILFMLLNKNIKEK